MDRHLLTLSGEYTGHVVLVQCVNSKLRTVHHNMLQSECAAECAPRLLFFASFECQSGYYRTCVICLRWVDPIPNYSEYLLLTPANAPVRYCLNSQDSSLCYKQACSSWYILLDVVHGVVIPNFCIFLSGFFKSLNQEFMLTRTPISITIMPLPYVLTKKV